MGNRLHVRGGVVRPGRLYIKIFLSFLVVLIITEMLIFCFFLFGTERLFRDRVEGYMRAYASVVRQLVEEKVRQHPETALIDNQALQAVVTRLSEESEAKVWLSGQDEAPLIKSFQGDVPTGLKRRETGRTDDVGGKVRFQYSRWRWVYHVAIPIDLAGGKKGHLHMLFERPEREHPRWGFALGLLVIGGVIALLLIPVSRRITNRITQLKTSALRIAEGDLAHRASVKGNDEIGDLGRAFNVMADKVERMVQGGKELTRNVSHELRSPLTRIRVAAELIREKWSRGAPDQADPHLNAIMEDVEEMDRLIGRILELSKLDVHEKAARRENFDPDVLVTELLERFGPSMSLKKLTLSTELGFHAPFAGDREMLTTALSNLLDNAIKFTPSGGRITVRTRAQGGLLGVTVTNTSTVLPEADLARIFEPFYRGGRDRETGSGLGLAITKKIIERMGGTIEANNAEEGFQVHVRLPQ
jgi:two-component system sensor histidine kinase CpxA